VSCADDDNIELFGKLLHPARLGPSPFARATLGIRGSGFRRAARTPRRRLNLASGVSCADDDNIELFGELH